jgi:hypothetical protein
VPLDVSRDCGGGDVNEGGSKVNRLMQADCRGVRSLIILPEPTPSGADRAGRELLQWPPDAASGTSVGNSRGCNVDIVT